MVNLHVHIDPERTLHHHAAPRIEASKSQGQGQGHHGKLHVNLSHNADSVAGHMMHRIESDDAAKAHRESQAIAREHGAVKALLTRVVASCGLPTVMKLLAEVVEEGSDTA